MILIYLHPSSFFPTNMLSLLIFESCMVSFFLQGNGRKPDVEHVLRTMAGHPQRFLSLRFCFFRTKVHCLCLAACLFALSKQPIFFGCWNIFYFLICLCCQVCSASGPKTQDLYIQNPAPHLPETGTKCHHEHLPSQMLRSEQCATYLHLKDM